MKQLLRNTNAIKSKAALMSASVWVNTQAFYASLNLHLIVLLLSFFS